MLHTSLKFLLVGFIGTGLLMGVHGCDESPKTDEMSQTRGGNEVSGIMTLTDLGQEMERRMDMMLEELLSPDQQVPMGASDMTTLATRSSLSRGLFVSVCLCLSLGGWV